jgi:thiol-disulfide isomerase/thioredoxin
MMMSGSNSNVMAAGPGMMMSNKSASQGSGALPVEGQLPPLSGATTWLNSPPLTADGLRGKVVLIDFWTYSCINCLRAIPYVRAWAEKYRGQAWWSSASTHPSSPSRRTSTMSVAPRGT